MANWPHRSSDKSLRDALHNTISSWSRSLLYYYNQGEPDRFLYLFHNTPYFTYRNLILIPSQLIRSQLNIITAKANPTTSQYEHKPCDIPPDIRRHERPYYLQEKYWNNLFFSCNPSPLIINNIKTSIIIIA